MTLLPDNILSKIADPAEKKRLGRAGLTMPELLAKNSNESEKTLHSQYIGFLRRHGFKPWHIVHAPMNKRSQLPEGFPDFQIQRGGKHLYIEFKVGSNTLDPMQEIVIADLIADGCAVLVLYSYSEAINETIKYFNL